MKGIYKLSWLNNPYFYVGQSCKLKERFAKHLVRLRSGKHENNRIQNVYNKYGEPLFEILLITDDLDKEEQILLDIHFSDEYCCNICPTANSTQGYKHTEEVKRKIGELSKRKVFNDEYRKRLRERKPNITMLGKKHTDDAKLKMSVSRKGKAKSEIHRKKISESNRNTPRVNSCKIENLETGQVFESFGEAARHLGINKSTLKYHLRRSNTFFKKGQNEIISKWKIAQPANVRKVFLLASGAISQNEA